MRRTADEEEIEIVIVVEEETVIATKKVHRVTLAWCATDPCRCDPRLRLVANEAVDTEEIAEEIVIVEIAEIVEEIVIAEIAEIVGDSDVIVVVIGMAIVLIAILELDAKKRVRKSARSLPLAK